MAEFGFPVEGACQSLPVLSDLINASSCLGVRIRVNLGNIDPLKKVPFKRARSRVEKGPFQGSP